MNQRAITYVAKANLTALVQLVEKSLVEFDSNGCYQIHPLLRQYGNEKLISNSKNKELVQERYTDYFMGLLEIAVQSLRALEAKEG